MPKACVEARYTPRICRVCRNEAQEARLREAIEAVNRAAAEKQAAKSCDQAGSQKSQKDAPARQWELGEIGCLILAAAFVLLFIWGAITNPGGRPDPSYDEEYYWFDERDPNLPRSF